MKRIVTLLGLLFVITAQAAAPLIWQSSDYAKFLTRQGYRLFDNKEFRSLTVDPSAGGGVVAPIGSVGLRDNAGTGEAWFKIGAADTAWSNVLTASTGWSLLGNTGTNDAVNFLGTTDAQDLVLKTNNTTRLTINDAGQFIYQPNEMLHQGTIGAVAGNYNQNFYGQTFSSTIGGNYLGVAVSPTFQDAITSGFFGYRLTDVWESGSSVTGWTGINYSSDVQAGATMGNMVLLNGNVQIAAGTLTGSSFTGVNLNPQISSNFLGYNGSQDNPTLTGTLGFYNGYYDAPQFAGTSSIASNFKAFSAQPNVSTGATFTSGVGYFSGGIVASGVSINDWTGFQDSTDIDSAHSSYAGISINPQGSGDVSTAFLSTLSPNLSGNNTTVVGYNLGGTIGNNVTNYTGMNLGPSATGTVTNVNGIIVSNNSISSPNPKVGLTTNEGSLNINALYDTSLYSPGLGGIGSMNLFGGTFTVANGFPVTGGGAMIANNLAMPATFNDNMPIDVTGGLVGYTDVGFVTALSVDSAATVHTVNMALAGGGIPASSTGGTINYANMYTAAGLLNQGGTVDVDTEMRGFYVNSNLCTFVSGECFGVKVEGNAQAQFSYGVELATSAVQPSCTATNRGQLWNIQGGAGVADEYEICQKNAADVYSWQSVGSGLDLSQYLFLPGRSGGQIATGGVDASDNLTLRSTTNATKGQVILDETTASTSPTTGALRVDGGVGVGGAVNVAGAIRSNTSLVLEDPGAGTNTTTIQAGTVTTSYSVTLPPAQGAVNTTLINDGSGVLSWGVVSSTPDLFGSRSVPRTIVAGTGITSGASDMSTTAPRQIVFIDGTGGVDITATPQIEAGTVVGQEMRVCGTDDTDYVLLENGDGLSLNGDAQLGKDDCINLMWLGSDGVTSDWVEQSRNF